MFLSNFNGGDQTIKLNQAVWDGYGYGDGCGRERRTGSGNGAPSYWEFSWVIEADDLDFTAQPVSRSQTNTKQKGQGSIILYNPS